MAKLILSRDAQVVQEVALDGGRITLGRHPHNDIVLADPAVSGHHAAITCDGADTDATLEDLGSSNGTLVNGKRITQARLADRDRFRIGGFDIAYVAGPAPLEGSIEVLNGANAGKTISLVKPLTTLGSPGVLVVVISRRDDGYYIVRMQGSGAAWLNGEALGRTPRLLGDGDMLELTGTRMRFCARSC